MFNLGFPEIALVLFVSLIVFGPNRLPEIARSMGKFLRNFQSETNRAMSDLKAGLQPATHGIFDTPDAGSEQPGAGTAATGFIPAEEMRATRTRTGSRPKPKAASARTKPSRAKPAADRAKTTTRRAPAKKTTSSRPRAAASKAKRKG